MNKPHISAANLEGNANERGMELLRRARQALLAAYREQDARDIDKWITPELLWLDALALATSYCVVVGVEAPEDEAARLCNKVITGPTVVKRKKKLCPLPA
jgi:hypothetical protein